MVRQKSGIFLVLAVSCSGTYLPHQRSMYDEAPCEYVTIIHPTSQLARDITSATARDTVLDAECRYQMYSDLIEERSFFDIQAGAFAPSTPMWRRLATFFVAGPAHDLPCSGTDLAAYAADPRAVETNFGLIVPDANGLFPATVRAVIGEQIQCYHFRDQSKFYKSGYMTLLKPIVNAFDLTTDDGLRQLRNAYHALNSIIRPGFSDFGDIVPKLWYERIRDFIGNTGPTNRWFDHLLEKVIKSFTGVPEALSLRFVQVCFIFGRNGCIIAYNEIAKGIRVLVGSEEKVLPIQIDGSGDLRDETAVENYVFGRLNDPEFDIVKEINASIKKYMSRSDRSIYDRFGGVLPTRDPIEMMGWGLRRNTFESSASMSYTAFVRYRLFSQRDALSKNSFVKPLSSTATQIYNGLKKFKEMELAPANSIPRRGCETYPQFRADIIDDICRISRFPNGSPRSFTAANIASLGQITPPPEIPLGEFNQLLASIDGDVKNRFMNGIDCSATGFHAHPYVWVWIKLSAVLFFEFDIPYAQTTSTIFGGIINMYGGQNFNFAIEILSAVLPGIIFINNEIDDKFILEPMRPFVSPDIPKDIDRDVIVGIIFPNFQSSLHVGVQMFPPPVAPYPPVFDQPFTQYLTNHVLNCGVSAKIASLIYLVRRLDPLRGPEFLDLLTRRANQATADSYGTPEFRTALYRVYLARVFDIYNLVLFRDTLEGGLGDHTPLYETYLDDVAFGNPKAASLRVITDTAHDDYYTCGVKSYLRIRTGKDCSETFSFDKAAAANGWDMIGQVEDDKLLMEKFNRRMLCRDEIGEPEARKFGSKLRDFWRNEVYGAFLTNRVIERHFIAGGQSLGHLLTLDETNSAIDCVGLEGKDTAPVTQVTCVFKAGPQTIIANRKMKKQCKSRWMTDVDDKHLIKIRRFCPIIGANYIRLQQAAYETKIEEFMRMDSYMEPQQYISKPTETEFTVALIGPGGSHIRLSNPDNTTVEIWPLWGMAANRIPTIPVMDTIVKEALIARSYVPCTNETFVHVTNPFEELYSQFVLNIEDSVLSIHEKTGIIACKFMTRSNTPQYSSFTLYRYWSDIEGVLEGWKSQAQLVSHCNEAGSLWYKFEKKISDIATRPKKFRSTKGFEVNDKILNYWPAQFSDWKDTMVEYRRLIPNIPIGGFKVTEPNGCSIDIEITDRPFPMEAWQHASGYFYDVCRATSTGRPGAPIVMLTGPGAFFCDNEIVSIRCELTAAQQTVPAGTPQPPAERIVITHTSPRKSENDFTKALLCEKRRIDVIPSWWISRYNKAISDHCLSMGTDLITAVRGYVAPSAPPIP